MGNITAYNKYIVALVMAVYNIVNYFWHINIPWLADEATTTIIVNAVLSTLVALIPNKPKVP
jgi:hypothetical protein